MDTTTGKERRTVVYSGRVQGVGFRATARQLAKGFALTGYVRNQADGTVELVVEGTADEIERYLHSIATALGSYIRQTQTSRSSATGEYGSFEIQV